MARACSASGAPLSWTGLCRRAGLGRAGPGAVRCLPLRHGRAGAGAALATWAPARPRPGPDPPPTHPPPLASPSGHRSRPPPSHHPLTFQPSHPSTHSPLHPPTLPPTQLSTRPPPPPNQLSILPPFHPLNSSTRPPPPTQLLQVLSSAEFRLQTVIEAAMEIAGLHAAQKRLQVAYHIAQSGARRWRAVSVSELSVSYSSIAQRGWAWVRCSQGPASVRLPVARRTVQSGAVQATACCCTSHLAGAARAGVREAAGSWRSARSWRRTHQPRCLRLPRRLICASRTADVESITHRPAPLGPRNPRPPQCQRGWWATRSACSRSCSTS